MAGLYCWGLYRVRGRGIAWSRWRSASFLLGCAALVLVTGLQIERYGYSLFSVFMFQHLTLSMTIPPLLVVGSPGRLLLRATAHHGAGRWVLIAALTGLRSRAGRIALHPGLTIPLFLFSYYGLYLSSIFDVLAITVIGHVSMEIFFFASGLLFIIPVLAVGPLPVRQSNLGRLFDLFVEMPLHVFFGVILMMSSTPMLATFAFPPRNGASIRYPIKSSPERWRGPTANRSPYWSCSSSAFNGTGTKKRNRPSRIAKPKRTDTAN